MRVCVTYSMISYSVPVPLLHNTYGVLGVVIHHPPLYLLVKGMCGHPHPHRGGGGFGVSALTEICENKQTDFYKYFYAMV